MTVTVKALNGNILEVDEATARDLVRQGHNVVKPADEKKPQAPKKKSE